MGVSETAELRPNALGTPPTGHHIESSCLMTVSHALQACGHDHESQAESAPLIPLPTHAPAIVGQVQALVLPDLETAPFADGTDRSLASIPIALRTPLRV